MSPQEKNISSSDRQSGRANRRASESASSGGAKPRVRAARLFEVNAKAPGTQPAFPLAPRRPQRSWRLWLLGVMAAMCGVLWVAKARQPDNPDQTPTPPPTDQSDATASPGQMEDLSDTNQVPEDEIGGTNAPDQIGQTNAPGRPRHFIRRRSRSNGTGNTPGSGDDLTTAPGRPPFSTFSGILRNNIFDPNRRPGIGPRQDTTPQPSIESFALRGTASLGGGDFAIFDGTRSEYHKNLKLSDSIAGYKITSITPDAVKLAAGTNQVELRVGMQMGRQEGGPWIASEASRSYASTSGSTSTYGGNRRFNFHSSTFGAPQPAPTAEPPPSGPASDILQRLMKQREE